MGYLSGRGQAPSKVSVTRLVTMLALVLALVLVGMWLNRHSIKEQRVGTIGYLSVPAALVAERGCAT